MWIGRSAPFRPVTPRHLVPSVFKRWCHMSQPALSELAELLLLAIVSAYGRSSGRYRPATLKKQLQRSRVEISSALDELVEKGVVRLMPGGSVAVTDAAFHQPVFAPFREGTAAEPRLVAGFLLTARTVE
jgi:hypothetical protein